MCAGLCIGTSGWNYDTWKTRFYDGVPKKEWLAYCASRFTGMEINATFYRLQRSGTFQRWFAATPDDFRFAMKGHRFVTHNKKLAVPRSAIDLEREQARALGAKLRVVLWQLPRQFHKDLARLDAFGGLLRRWPEVRHSVEFRHPSWFDEEVAECLRRFGLANCQSDAGDWPLWDAVTTDLVYVRLHGRPRTYASAYRSEALQAWAEKIRRWHHAGYEVHVYFDNDAEGAAPHNALELLARLRDCVSVSHDDSTGRALP